MSFYESGQNIKNHPFEIHNGGTVCACCGESITGPSVVYDLQLEPGVVKGLAMHRDCAFATAQRIICDAWPNRRVSEPMQNNR